MAINGVVKSLYLGMGLACLMGGAAGLRAQEPLLLLTFHEPPWVDVQADARKVTGIAVQVIEQVFASAGESYRLQVVPPKRAYLLATRQANTCVFPLERNQNREASLQWVGPVMTSRHAFYASKELPVRLQTLEDARPLRIGSYLGSGVGEYLERQGFRVTLSSSNELGPAMLDRDRIDLWVSDVRSARPTAQAAGLDLGPPALVFFTTLQAMGCNLNIPEVRIERLQAALLKLIRQGKLAGLMDPQVD